MRQEKREFQSPFLSTCKGKSTDQLWQDFKGKVDYFIGKRQNVTFWFDFCFTALQHILGHFGRGQLP